MVKQFENSYRIKEIRDWIFSEKNKTESFTYSQKTIFEFFHSFLGLQGVHKTWNTYNIIFDVLNSGKKNKRETKTNQV